MSEDSSKNQWQTITNGAPAAPDFWKTGFLPQPNRRPFNASEIGTFIDQLGTVDVLSWAEEPDDDASLQALMAKQWHYGGSNPLGGAPRTEIRMSHSGLKGTSQKRKAEHSLRIRSRCLEFDTTGANTVPKGSDSQTASEPKAPRKHRKKNRNKGKQTAISQAAIEAIEDETRAQMKREELQKSIEESVADLTTCRASLQAACTRMGGKTSLVERIAGKHKKALDKLCTTIEKSEQDPSLAEVIAGTCLKHSTTGHSYWSTLTRGSGHRNGNHTQCLLDEAHRAQAIHQKFLYEVRDRPKDWDDAALRLTRRFDDLSKVAAKVSLLKEKYLNGCRGLSSISNPSTRHEYYTELLERTSGEVANLAPEF